MSEVIAKLAVLHSGPKFAPQPKGQSRLQVDKAETKITVVDEKKFKREVWIRDQAHCRKCKCKVIKQLARDPKRGEVHHLHGRIGDLQFEAKCALLVCAECHEQLTGRVDEKWIAVGTKFWKLPNGDRVIDARAKLKFQRVV